MKSHIYGNIATMKTTVDIDTALYKTARKRAVDEGRPFRAVLNDALRAFLAMPPPRPAAKRPSRSRRAATGPRLSQPADGGHAVTQAEFWAIVNDRSRWDELFGDRLQEIESEIAVATAEWERRRRQ